MNSRTYKLKSGLSRRRPNGRQARLGLEELETRLVPSTNVTAYHQASPVPNPPSTIGAGVNSNESILTPANVNSTDFGKLFATTVDGQVYAQPLYMENIDITTGANQGTHNVVFVATENDSLYAIDSGAGVILWHDALLTAAHGGTVSAVPNGAVNSGDISPEIGITATPVIDPTTNTIFVEAKEEEVASDGTHFEHYLYAINIGSGAITNHVLIADSIGDTVVSGPAVEGTGAGSVNGVVQFDALRQLDRPALTLVNGNIYLAFASHGDNGPYHGWVLGYSESTLAPTAVFNADPNGSDAGVWQSGGALAYETVNGNTYLYFETGNGTFDTTLTQSPFSSGLMVPNQGDYGDTFLKVEIDGSTPASGSLDATNNVNGWGMHVADYFTPLNEGNLSGGDVDLGSGAPLLLPASAGSAAHPNLLVGAGKEGRIYLIDRDNMGGYHGDAAGDGNSGSDNIVQETLPGTINGSLDTPTYYGGALYYVGGYGDEARTFTISDAVMSSTAATQSADSYGFPGSTPTISTNPAGENAIVWDIAGPGTNQLRAYNASAGYADEIYTSAQAANGRDSLGNAVKFTVPTVADGEVFVGTSNSVVAYGILQQATAAPAAPTNLAASALSGSVIQLTWTDNDTTPNSAVGYNILESTNGTSFTQVGTASAGATSFAVGGLRISTTYYFEIDAFNTVGTSAFSNVASATTTNQTGLLNFSSGFANSTGALTYNGSAKINGTSAELTDGGANEAGSFFSTNPVDITNFSNQFSFQLTNATANGFTFCIQGAAATALGPSASGLGYGATVPGGTPGIPDSVAIKFDLANSDGEGTDSTGEYTDGASPTIPAIDLSATGINLHSGDVFDVTMTFNGTDLAVTITDTSTNATVSESYAVNIPQLIGSDTGYVGFTGGTGTNTAVQNILTWAFSPTATSAPAAPTNLTGIVVSGSEIDISWTNNANNATEVLVDRSTDGVNFTQIAALSGTANSYNDTSLSPGNTYYYEVQAANAAGDSAFSNVFIGATLTPPLPPTNVTGTNITTAEVDLSWTNNATNATGIEILKQLGNNSSQVIASGLPATTNSYKITGLTPGSPYLFEIDALNSNGPSSSASISVDTLPSQVTGVNATAGLGSITITWSADPGAATYNVYRATTAGGEGTTPTWAGITGTSYVDTTATPGSTYYYVVSAVDPKSASPTDLAGESARSAEVSATTLTYQLNISAGGPAAGSFVADADFTGGGAGSATGATINTSGIPEPPPQSVLQHSRIGNFTYTIPGLVAGVSYTVRLDFDEYYWSAAGSRIFDVSINGSPVLSNFDIFAAAGGKDIAIAESFATTATSSGTIIITFTTVKDNAQANGIEIDSSSTTPVPPPAPTGLAATAGNDQVALGWTAVAGATGYDVYRGTSSGAETLLSAGTNVATTSFTDTSAVNGTQYFYYLTALNGTLQSGASNEVSATPQAPTLAAPTGLTATPGNNQVVLSWNAVTGATGYDVYRGITSGGETLLASGTDITTTTFTDTGVVNGTQYFYYVTAVNGSVQSGASSEVSATPQAPTLSAPTGLTATAGNNQVSLTWNAVTGATGYDVYRGTSSGSEMLLSGGTNVATASFTDTTAVNGTQYFYYVTAVNGSVQSGKSNEVSATPQVPATNGLVLAISAGGPAAGSFDADTDFSGGAVGGATGATINTSAITNPPPQSVLQHSRIGNFTYTIPGLIAGDSYTVRLDFDEPYWSAAGSRLFDVSVDGTQVLSNFDVFAASGGKDIAIAESFAATASASGTITIAFTTVKDNALVSGIEIYAAGSTPVPPQPPSGLTATAGNNQVVLSWTAVAGATGYDVYRGASSGGETLLAAGTNISSNTFTDTSAVNGTQYFYYVTTLNGTVQSAHSSEVSALPQGPISGSLVLGISAGGPAAGSFLADTDFAGGSVGGATGATINTSAITNPPPQSVLQNSRIGNFSYTIPGLTAGSSYTVRLDFDEPYWSSPGARVFDVSINGTQVLSNFDIFAAAGGKDIAIGEAFPATASASGTVTIAFTTLVDNALVNGIEIYSAAQTAPAAPTGLTATAGNNQVGLTWNGMSGATGYDVYRGTSSGGETLLAAGTNVTTASFTDATAVNGTQYFYDVTALNSIGQSGASNEVSATPQAPTLAAPTGLTATAGNNQVGLTWNAVTGATGYDVYRGATSGGETLLAAGTDVTTASFTDTAAVNGTHYFYYVTAVNGASQSAQSNEVSATPQAPTPAAPTGLTATAGNNQVGLTWNAVTGATGYDVYRGTSSGGETLLAAGTNVSTAAYTDTSAVDGTQYFYYVTALNGSLQSGASNEVSATPQNATTSPILAISAGGPAAGSFVADTDFTGGGVSGGTHATINTSGLPNPPPQSVVQHGRFGNFTYTIPGLTSGVSYTVRLDFVEYYFGSAGARVFDVAINGTPVLTNFDIFAAAGGKNIAIARSFAATASATGTITIGFNSVVNNSMINGIEIYAAGTATNVKVQSATAGAVLHGNTQPPKVLLADSSGASRLRALDVFLAQWGGDWEDLLDPKHRGRSVN